MTATEVRDAVVHLPGAAKYVVISGGNPVLHDLGELVDMLHERDFQVSVETQGSVWKEWLRKVDVVCLSPKGPSARMQHKWNPEVFNDIVMHLLATSTKVFIKVPIFNEGDVAFLEGLILKYGNSLPFYASIGNSWAPGSELAESHPSENPTSLKDFRHKVLDHTRWVTELLLENPILKHVRIVPQMHTLLWGNELGR